MKIILILLVAGVLMIDFVKLDKSNKKIFYIYGFIVIMILLVVIAEKYEFFKTTPIEIGVEKMRPITDWIEIKLQ
ncbi:hypothetical protein CACET_c04830 [Clostridium aceticum]|uniref:Uncharacterized protein n=1 Tax=Clostridium aceticum TaxID=84022 RepID=A0A0D8IE71_9CLOT|nr:hypothetical protein [Clostridium aceticum]AKL93993.1 hypothetical protein CACET_c04830 [Clostridium aceticum]KJF28625.1 hypothetical protein TZ02_01580 [Clostridium aceticum]